MLKLNNKPCGQWSLEDIFILLDSDEWRESEIHDYKSEWKKPDDELKKDICSFANHKGGIIFFGIKESNGIATELCGVENLGEDAFELILGNSLSNCIEPVKPSFSIQVIPLDSDKCILVLEIREGYNKPYCNKNDKRFFIRGNAGKEAMTYMQLEEMFLNTNSLYERIEQFLDKRVQSLENQSNTNKAYFQGKAYLAIHLIPVTALLSQRKRYNLTKLPKEHQSIFSSNPFGEDYEYESSKMNADGFCRGSYRKYEYSPIQLRQTRIQIFWSGILEAVTTSVFGYVVEHQQLKHLQALYAGKAVWELLDDAKRLYETIGLDEPVIAVISLRNVSPYVIYFDFAYNRSLFEQNNNRSSDVLLDLSEPNIQEDKKHLLDELGYMLGRLDFCEMLRHRGQLD